MREVVIVSSVRTPIGSFMGALSDVSAVEMGALVIAEAMKRAELDPDRVQEVIMGNVLQAGTGQGPARQAMLLAGLTSQVPAFTINKICGSGLKAVILAAQAIKSGDADLIIAGGMENMSQAPYLLPKVRKGYKMGHGELVDSMLADGLQCAVNDIHMGITAENIAEKYGITRDEQDSFALESQKKAEKAWQEMRFSDEIVPVPTTDKKGREELFEKDEHLRAGVTKEQLAKLKPVFKKDGTVTAGNASGINDGAAAVVVCALDKAKEWGLKPAARIRSYASSGVDPAVMGMGPVPATKEALKKAGMEMKDLQLVELNEAFAAQAIAVLNELDLDRRIVNVNGGAVALGHPIGASGARILVTLLHEMQKRQLETGLATLCVGGGHGVSMIVESI